MARIGELLGRYADLRLGLADACVIACAERYGGRVLASTGETSCRLRVRPRSPSLPAPG